MTVPDILCRMHPTSMGESMPFSIRLYILLFKQDDNGEQRCVMKFFVVGVPSAEIHRQLSALFPSLKQDSGGVNCVRICVLVGASRIAVTDA